MLLTKSETTQIDNGLVDGSLSTYTSLLSVTTGPYALTGYYACTVLNLLGSVSQNISVKGQ